MTALQPDCQLISVSCFRLLVKSLSSQLSLIMITSRDTELAERLRQAAASGRTKTVIELLEEGAPFIVDSVSILSRVKFWDSAVSTSLENNRLASKEEIRSASELQFSQRSSKVLFVLFFLLR